MTNQGLIQGATEQAAAPIGHPGNDAWRWAEQINSEWRKSLQSVIETGRILLEAKASLVHGSFEAMVQTALDFSPRVAQRLMAIARDDRLSNPTHASLLPHAWTTLYELTTLTDEEFERGLVEQIIRPDMERKDVDLIRPRAVLENSSAVEQGAVNAHVAGSIPASPANREGGAGEPVGYELPGNAGSDGSGDAPLTAGSPAPAHLPSGGLAIAHQRIEPADSADFFPTPPWATRALVERVLRHLQIEQRCKLQTVWEPACGEGHMVEVLAEYFRSAFGSDKIDYGRDYDVVDFLDPDAHPTTAIDWIITNPPFNDSADFVLRALQLAGTGVAMFVRLAWLESADRYERIFKIHPPTLISIFAERVPLHKGRWEADGSTMTAYVWLTWIKGAEPRAPYWIPPGCRRDLAKPEDVERFAEKLVAKQQTGEAAA